MEQNEELIWKGSPSQWTNFWIFLSSILVVPIPIAFWKWLSTEKNKYEITSERIIHQQGVFKVTVDDVELYRVKDIRIEQPFVYRMLGLSNLIVVSSDRTRPSLTIPAIKNGLQVREQLRKAVEKRRDEKRAREMDFTGGGDIDL